MDVADPAETVDLVLRLWGNPKDRTDWNDLSSLIADLQNCPRVLQGVEQMKRDHPNGCWLFTLVSVTRECGRESRNRYLRSYAGIGAAARRPKW
ncbi:hypothetical protein [Modestobacter sp. SYSU DS0657]